MTGQMERGSALARLARSEMDDHFMEKEFEYVANKLDLSVSDLQGFFDAPSKTFRNYKNKRSLIRLGATLMRILGVEKRYLR